MKIRERCRRVDGREYRDFVVDLGKIDGKRRVRVFAERKDAEGFLREAMEARRVNGARALSFDATRAARFAAIEERLGGVAPEAAAEFYLANHSRVRERITAGKMFDRCLLDKQAAKLTSHYLATFACSVGSFLASRRDRDVASITREEVKEWVRGNGWSPRTERGYLADVRSFFSWGVSEGYLHRSPLAGARGEIALSKMVRREPAIFSPEQIAQLFRTAETRSEIGRDADGRLGRVRVYRPLLGFLALATFAGIRPHELARLPVSAVDIEGGTASLDAAVSKTSDRRVVELSANCRAWLRVWRKEFPGLKRVAPPSWDRHMKALRKASGLVPWPHDVLRHCFASYYHATHGDKAKLQAMMGHSAGQDTLERHYRAVRTKDGRPLSKALAAQFWKIKPR